MKSMSGFSLIEFLIYFFLVALLSLLMVDFLASRYVVLMSYGAAGDGMLGLCAAYDTLERDVYIFCNQESVWTELENGYVWSGLQDIGWRVDGGRLIRTQGDYDVGQGAWQQSTHSVVADHIAQFHLSPFYNNHRVIEAIHCRLVSSKTALSLDRTIFLKNRSI